MSHNSFCNSVFISPNCNKQVQIVREKVAITCFYFFILNYISKFSLFCFLDKTKIKNSFFLANVSLSRNSELQMYISQFCLNLVILTIFLELQETKSEQ